MTYLFILLEHSGQKINWASAPVPKARTRIACERMYGSLKTKLKDEITAMIGEAKVPDKVAKSEPRARSKKDMTPASGDDTGPDAASRLDRRHSKRSAPPSDDDAPAKKIKKVKAVPVIKEEPIVDEGEDEET